MGQRATNVATIPRPESGKQRPALRLVATPPEAEFSHERRLALDVARGLTVLAMILFHFTFDLVNFTTWGKQINLYLPHAYWTVLPMSIGASFLGIMGISACLRLVQDRERVAIRLVRRGVQLFCLGLGISFVTNFVVATPIYFGILHCMGASLLLLTLFLNSPKWALRAGLTAIAAGTVLLQFTVSFPYLLWLGLMPGSDAGWDYYPLLPWVGFVLVGFWLGHKIANGLEPASRWCARIPGAKWAAWLGRHSLLIYLAHQPLLLGIILLWRAF